MDSDDNSSEIQLKNGEAIKNLRLEEYPSTMEEDSNVSEVSAEDISEEVMKKLRGDAIGDTVYSERFVLELLLQFQDMTWNEEAEQKFAYLWDMTEEPDVCHFLWSLDFPSLAAQIVTSRYNEPRLMEILMGTLSNVAFVCKETIVVSPEHMQVFLDLFYCCNNGQALTQVVNFFGHVWGGNVLINLVDSKFYKRIMFILINSLNCELLYETLSCLTLMCINPSISECLVSEDLSFIKYCVMAFKSVFVSEQKENDSTFNIRQYNCFYNLMCIVTYIASSTLNDKLQEALNLASESLVKQASVMFRFFSRDEETLEKLHEPETLFNGLSIFLVAVKPIPYHGRLCKSLLKILISATRTNMCCEALVDLVKYFICCADDYEQLKNDCLEVGEARMLRVLETIDITNEWSFGNKVMPTQNLLKLSQDLNKK